jgi:hypothetical protein
MKPISLHPDNAHYFLFHGKPTVLLTSAEHYGAVLNSDFNYSKYLDALHAKGFNLTRIFTGVYMEDPQSFGIRGNSMAPKEGKLLCPWARSDAPGYANGGAKFDLNQWDDAYFQRLKDFCHQADERGIAVEVSLFCPYYEDGMWNISPINARNNVNGVGDVSRLEALTMKHPELVAVEDAMVRKIVSELKDCANVYYEICNEPYFGGVTLEWQHHIAETITKTEADYPAHHLIAQNIANGSQKIEDPDPLVSLFNFHYANPPVTIAENWGLKKAIGFDESGFRGIHDEPYRTEAWEFLLAGGSEYNMLDYSFTVGHEDGSFPVPEGQPGGGGASLQKQFGILRQFIHGFDFLKMAPDSSVVAGGIPEGVKAYALSEPGKAYALYVKGETGVSLTLSLPAGRYEAEWVNTKTGAVEKPETFDHAGGTHLIVSPPYEEDIALRIRRK